MKKRVLLRIVLLFAVLFLLTACRNPFASDREAPDTLMVQDPGTVYGETHFSLPEDMAVNRGLPAEVPGEDLREFTVTENGIYAVYRSTDGTDAAAAFARDGTIVTTFP